MAKNRLEIRQKVIQDIPDNVTQQVSPADIRDNILDILDNSHLLPSGKSILAGNFSTPATRNTRVGEESTMNLALPGHVCSDNAALGYYTINSIYTGSYNTALGSYSQSCNVFGDYNNSMGYSSLGAVVRGSGNTGIGSFALQRNKDGDFNIGIGHGAGYWIENNDSYKLFIGVHEVNESNICADPDGSGERPFLVGDMLNYRAGFHTKELSNISAFEVHNRQSDRIQEWYDTSGIVVAYVDNSGTFFSNANDGFQIPSEFGWTSWNWDGVLASGDTYLQQIFDKLDNLYPKLNFTHTGFSGVLDTGDDTLQKIFDRVDQNHRPIEMKFILTNETTPVSGVGDIFSFHADFDFLLTSIKTRAKTGTNAEYGITVNGSNILSGVLLSSSEYDFKSGIYPGYSILEDDLIQISLEASGTNSTGLKMTFRGATPVNSPYYNGTVGSWNDIY